MATPAKLGEDPDRDLGFGGRVAQETRQRFLNRDGSFNAERHGLPFFRSLTLYHALLNVSWPVYFLIAAAGYLATNLVFALGFLACGPGGLRGSEAVSSGDRFLEAFFFSVHTLATIGYGHLAPAGLAANLLVTLEALVGLLGFALVTGLLFARVSRPTTRILFSRQAVIAPYQAGSALMFRIVNERSSQLIEVEASVSLAWFERRAGVPVRRFHELALERKGVVFFPLHWVIVHPIDERSPLFGVTPEAFAAADPEVLILLTAVDETFSQTVHARSSYKGGEVIWGARFKDMFARSDSGRVAIDLTRLHEIERLT